MVKPKQIAELKVADAAHSIANEIVEIAAAIRALSKTRLKRDTIVLLLHDHTKPKVGKRQIEAVLNALDSLELATLKPQRSDFDRVIRELTTPDKKKAGK